MAASEESGWLPLDTGDPWRSPWGPCLATIAKPVGSPDQVTGEPDIEGSLTPNKQWSILMWVSMVMVSHDILIKVIVILVYFDSDTGI